MTFLPLLFAVAPVSGNEASFYIGTYTSPGGSEGIYRAKLNLATGELSAPTLAAKTSNPSFVAIHPDGRYVYAVNENDKGEVSAFSVQSDRSLRFLNAQPSQGAAPCHLIVDPAGKNVLSANYMGGSVSSSPITSDGSLGAPTAFFKNAGTGPDRGRQEAPHMHAVAAGPDGRIYACDLGTDEVLAYRFDPAKGALDLNDPRSGKVPAGKGPRHLVFHPNGKFLYVNGEMGNSVTVFSHDAVTGSLAAVQTLSTLPEGETKSSTAEIALHPNGKWLYVSNRGHDSIAIFEIGSDGTLRRIDVVKAGVKIPRGFAIDPSGKWLVVAGQESNDLTALSIGPEGGLKPGPNRISVSKPVCVVFGR